LTGGNTAFYTNQGNGYAAKYSRTPGTNDLSVDPRFGDYQRSVELFDTEYLGHTATVWSAGATYTPGVSIVQSSDPTVKWNLPVNYRYREAIYGCSGANPQPGLVSTPTWRNCWEFASLYDLRQGIGAGTVYTDGAIGCASGCTPNQALMGWIRRGYTPQNPLLRKAAHDGIDTGAVQMDKIVVFPSVSF